MVEERLSQEWAGENANHVKGYRYLLLDTGRNISKASPPGKVATLTKVGKPMPLFLFFGICSLNQS